MNMRIFTLKRQKYCILVLLACLMLPLSTAAQKLEVVNLVPDIRDNTAWNPNTCRKLDDGRYCPVVKVRFKQNDCVFEGNIIGKPVFKTNEYWVYMNPGAYHLTVKLADHDFLDVNFGDYMEDGKLKERRTYILTLRRTDLRLRRDKLTKGFHTFIGASYQLIGFSGPVFNAGISVGPVYAEASLGIGTNTMDNVAIYRTQGGTTNLQEAYNYKAKTSMSMRVGFMADLDYLILMPFVGMTNTTIKGESIMTKPATTDFETLKPSAALAGVRLSFPIGKLVQVHVTPQFAFALNNDDYFKVVTAGASDMEAWAKGFQVAGGIVLRF